MSDLVADTGQFSASQHEAFNRRRIEIENEVHQFWSPHYGQVPVAQALFRGLKRYVFLQCGRKFGKTDFAIYCMYLFAIMFPNSQIYYIADTMKHGGELVWKNQRLQKFFLSTKRRKGESHVAYQMRRSLGKKLHEKYVWKSNDSEMRLYFNNGSWIKVYGAENFANADVLEPSFMVYDEFKSHDPRFNEAMEPNLRVFKAPLLILGTPPDEPETYYEKIANSVKRMGYGEWFKRPSYMNNFIYPLGEQDPEFVEECEKYDLRGDEDVKLRELYAEIVVSGSKSIFPVLQLPEWDYENDRYLGYSRHVRPHKELLAPVLARPKDFEFYDIYDAGSTSCFGVLIAAVHRRTKEVLILDEIYERDQRRTTTGCIYPTATDKRMAINGWEESWHGEYDNAAAWFAGEVLDRYERSLMPCTKDLSSRSENKKEIKLSLIKDMLIEGKLLISERCRWLIWEMKNYRRDENGKIPKENDHLIDCLRYLLNACHYDPSYVRPKEKIEDMRRALTIAEDMRENGYYGDYGLSTVMKEEYED
jgi:hypothetical protein